LSFSAVVILGYKSVFYPNVIVYPKMFDPLTAVTVNFLVFCVQCAFVMWSIKATCLLT